MHYEQFLILLAPSIGTLIVAIAGLIKATAAKVLAEENKETLEVVRKQFDGRLSQLMAKAEAAQRALGVTEGQDKERGIQREGLDRNAVEARKVVADALEAAILKLESRTATIDSDAVKATALDAVSEAVKHEIARAPVA